jgi:hypothetical protein
MTAVGRSRTVVFLKAAGRLQFAHTPVEIRQWPRSPNSNFLDDFGKRPLAKYTGQSTGKSPRAGLGRSRTVAFLKAAGRLQSCSRRW